MRAAAATGAIAGYLMLQWLGRSGNGKTRFIFRSRGRAGPAWVAAAYLLVIIPAGFVMSRQMLRGVKARAERTTAADLQAATGEVTRSRG